MFFKELIQEYSEEGALNHHSCDAVLNFVWNQVRVHVLPVAISQRMVKEKKTIHNQEKVREFYSESEKIVF